MRSKTLCAAVIILTPFLSTANAASTERILFSFNGTNGSGPNSSVIFDKAGNLYGTTSGGGAYGYGTVYKLSHDSDGSWTETILHNFSGSTDGANPSGALIWDSAGNLYGTTTAGGRGPGTVFELSPGLDGAWTEKVIFDLQGFEDGISTRRQSRLRRSRQPLWNDLGGRLLQPTMPLWLRHRLQADSRHQRPVERLCDP